MDKRPIIEVLQEFPIEFIKDKLVANHKAKPSFAGNCTAFCMADAITNAFNWQESPEGDRFWRRLYDKLIINFNYYPINLSNIKEGNSFIVNDTTYHIFSIYKTRILDYNVYVDVLGFDNKTKKTPALPGHYGYYGRYMEYSIDTFKFIDFIKMMKGSEQKENKGSFQECSI